MARRPLLSTQLAQRWVDICLRIARWSGIEFIGLVRHAESANALREMGAKHILVTSEG